MDKKTSIDIDTLEDFRSAEFLMQQKNNSRTKVA